MLLLILILVVKLSQYLLNLSCLTFISFSYSFVLSTTMRRVKKKKSTLLVNEVENYLLKSSLLNIIEYSKTNTWGLLQ